VKHKVITPPLISASTLEVWAPLLTGFSLGEAANNGFNQALSASLAQKIKSPLGLWGLKVIERGYHHFILGMWLLLWMSYYMPALWAVLVYWFSLGLVLSEADMLVQLLKEIENDISEAGALFSSQK